MTLSDLTSKTPEELNSKLHHALGFRWSLPDEAWYRNGSYVGTKIPNYTDSWDAIMPEVRKLARDQRRTYIIKLWRIVTGNFSDPWNLIGNVDELFAVENASPQHRTIALILTLHP